MDVEEGLRARLGHYNVTTCTCTSRRSVQGDERTRAGKRQGEDLQREGHSAGAVGEKEASSRNQPGGLEGLHRRPGRTLSGKHTPPRRGEGYSVTQRRTLKRHLVMKGTRRDSGAVIRRKNMLRASQNGGN